MTDKLDPDLHIMEYAGAWWGFVGEPPPPEAFKTHQRPRDSRIIGPFPTRGIAEALLAQRLAKAERDKRARASHRAAAPEQQMRGSGRIS